MGEGGGDDVRGLNYLLDCDELQDFLVFGLRQLAFLPPTNEDYKAIMATRLTDAERADLHSNFEFSRALLRMYGHGWGRHNNLMVQLVSMASKVGFIVRIEPRVNGLGHNGRGDAGILNFFGDGFMVIFDFSTTASDMLASVLEAARMAGVAAERRAGSKVRKYYDICWVNRLVFVPLVMEDTGFIHKRLHDFIRTCAMRAGDYEEAVPEFVNWAVRTYEDYWYHRLSCSLVTSNAQMFKTARAKVVRDL